MAQKCAEPSEVAQRATTLKAQVEHAFKRQLIRETSFKKQKLHLVDRQLDAGRVARQVQDAPVTPKNLPSAGATSSPEKAGPASAENSANRTLSRSGNRLMGPSSPLSASCPGLLSPSVADPYKDYRQPGAACSRFACSENRSSHPAIHPGVLRRPGTESKASTRRQQPVFEEGLLPSTPSRPVSALSKPSRPGTPGGKQSQPVSPQMAKVLALKVVRLNMPVRGSKDEVDEDDLEMEYESLNADTELAVLNGALHSKPSDKREMIDRLGDLINMLGPRYKQVSKEMIWKRAETGEQSDFQRRLNKLREMGVETNLLDTILKKDAGAAMELLTPDPEAPARVSWLDNRRKEKMKAVPLEQFLEGLRSFDSKT